MTKQEMIEELERMRGAEIGSSQLLRTCSAVFVEKMFFGRIRIVLREEARHEEDEQRR
jgi:hypothetical protein